MYALTHQSASNIFQYSNLETRYIMQGHHTHTTAADMPTQIITTCSTHKTAKPIVICLQRHQILERIQSCLKAKPPPKTGRFSHHAIFSKTSIFMGG